ncbi:MAG: hypothetical protein F7C37_04525 [Desulfurococcales archaeon]|nr:hypothetical protein [Desulfurococcales archaeon]
MAKECPFNDRTYELGALKKAFEKRPLFAIIYGWRRPWEDKAGERGH